MKRCSVRWSAEAIGNLRAIIEHIAVDSPSRAHAFAEKLLQSAARLGAFPGSGRRVPELADQIPPPREILVGEYRLLYREGARGVEIVTIVHGRRLLPRFRE